MLFTGLAALGVLAPSALAAPTASQITKPAGTTLARGLSDSEAQALIVRGTTTGSGNVDLRCYLGDGSSQLVRPALTVDANQFETSVSEQDVSALVTAPCVLRAVPAGDGSAHPPSAVGDPFQGPAIEPTFFGQVPNLATGRISDYTLLIGGTAGEMQLQSAWAGIFEAKLVKPATLQLSPRLFDLGSGFNGGDLINVDGEDAFVVSSISGAPAWQGMEDIRFEVDSTTGAMTLHAVEPIQAEPATPAVPTGVVLDRTWTIDHHGAVARLVDSWRSIDGNPHVLKVRYQDEAAGVLAGGAYDFPGSSGFQNYALNDQIPLSDGPATIYAKYDPAVPDAGDGTQPQGAITYSKAPDGPAKVVNKFTNGGESFLGFELPYQQTIPANGARTFRFTYSLGFALPDVRALAAAAQGSSNPVLAITTPLDGSSSATPDVTVTGTASGTAGTPALTVNGQATSVAADGSWTRQVTLSPGANTIAAIATDEDGPTTTRTVRVDYTPPGTGGGNTTPPQTVVTTPAQATTTVIETPAGPAKLSLVGRVRATKTGVQFQLKCTGQRCEGTERLQSVELIGSGGLVTGLRSAASHKRKTVTVGSGRFALAAGETETLTVKLNATGRKLLKRFKRVPAKLTVALTAAKPLTAGTTISR